MSRWRLHDRRQGCLFQWRVWCGDGYEKPSVEIIDSEIRLARIILKRFRGFKKFVRE